MEIRHDESRSAGLERNGAPAGRSVVVTEVFEE